MIVKKDVRNRDGYNDVEGVHILYTISQKTSEPATSVSGRLELDGERIGIISAERDGRMYVSIDQSTALTFAQHRTVISTVLTDIDSVFSESMADENTSVS